MLCSRAILLMECGEPNWTTLMAASICSWVQLALTAECQWLSSISCYSALNEEKSLLQLISSKQRDKRSKKKNKRILFSC